MTIWVCATATTFGLFSFMAFLIYSDTVNVIKPPVGVKVEVYQTPEDSSVETKPKMKFEPPTPPSCYASKYYSG